MRGIFPQTIRGLVCAVLVLPGLSVTSVVRAQSASEPRQSISVSGDARIDVEPDQAEVEGGVTSEAKEAGAAAAANAKAMAAIIEALKGAGIADKDIRTMRFAISPVWPPNRTPAMQITGYRASNHVRVKIRDVSRAATVLDTLVNAGANDVGGISFLVSDPDKHLDKARVDAMADARRKAEIYAKAAGVTLGAPLSISESAETVPGPIAYRSMAPAAPGAIVSPGEQTLRVNISVTYQIR